MAKKKGRVGRSIEQSSINSSAPSSVPTHPRASRQMPREFGVTRHPRNFTRGMQSSYRALFPVDHLFSSPFTPETSVGRDDRISM